MEKIVLIHGDVTFYEAAEIPASAKKVMFEKGFVIEKGEGVNLHTLETECEIYIDGDKMYFQELSEPIQVNHSEHGLRTVKTKTGIAVKRLERVWDYEAEEARKVVD